MSIYDVTDDDELAGSWRDEDEDEAVWVEVSPGRHRLVMPEREARRAEKQGRRRRHRQDQFLFQRPVNDVLDAEMSRCLELQTGEVLTTRSDWKRWMGDNDLRHTDVGEPQDVRRKELRRWCDESPDQRGECPVTPSYDSRTEIARRKTPRQNKAI